jgi:hypothetical protein
MNRFYSRASYPWPIPGSKLQEALDIAMDYLERTGQGAPYFEIEEACACVVVDVWNRGVRHRIEMANCAIVAIEKKRLPRSESSYSRGGLA